MGIRSYSLTTEKFHQSRHFRYILQQAFDRYTHFGRPPGLLPTKIGFDLVAEFKIVLQILFKNRHFGQKSKFRSKIEISVKNRSFGQKSMFWSKIEISVKKFINSALECPVGHFSECPNVISAIWTKLSIRRVIEINIMMSKIFNSINGRIIQRSVKKCKCWNTKDLAELQNLRFPSENGETLKFC